MGYVMVALFRSHFFCEMKFVLIWLLDRHEASANIAWDDAQVTLREINSAIFDKYKSKSSILGVFAKQNTDCLTNIDRDEWLFYQMSKMCGEWLYVWQMKGKKIVIQDFIKSSTGLDQMNQVLFLLCSWPIWLCCASQL